MPSVREVQPVRLLMGRLDHGEGLLEELTRVAQDNAVRLGRVEALGAVQCANLGFYDQRTRTYSYHEINKPLEITNLVGNVSLKDGEPIIHAHVTLADEEGAALGGHLGPGTTIFACEFVMHVLTGAELVRDLDEPTGLPLWRL